MGKIAGVIISHGQVANELLAAAETIVGETSHLTAVSIGWHDDVELAKKEIERAIEQVSSDRGVIILTDMFGGTPTNIAAMFLKDGAVEIVTGVNLPMVVKLAAYTGDGTLSEASKIIEETGKGAIYRTAALLDSRSAENG
ncbi:MAG: PTS sugar transporter subunit IIA [Acidobacteria bacterium]|nr:PTS sugar transporter subunit IIA [Acidobacteriota bacterium]